MDYKNRKLFKEGMHGADTSTVMNLILLTQYFDTLKDIKIGCLFHLILDMLRGYYTKLDRVYWKVLKQ